MENINISVYAFQRNSSTSSPFDILHLQIWNGKPSLPGSVVIFGDLINNVLSSSIDSMRYAIQNSLVPSPAISPNQENKIWKLTANVNVTLQAGTYWLAWQTHTISGKESYSPPVKIKGSRGLPNWNAIIYNALNVWQAAIDIGNPGSITTSVPQDVAFEITYSY
jgi:hypothetical protein